ncbi:hypothetical protein FF32_02345 [Halomonas campaniensis]|nr:hypothetical protein FF32_02345 [Halomonas campaniensis]
MNNVFRLIWNRTLGRLVVTSEAARSRDKAATRQGVVGQLPAPETASSIHALLRPAVVAVALAAGSMVLVAPEARAWTAAGGDDCNPSSNVNSRIAIGDNSSACADGAVSIGWGSSAGNINIELINEPLPSQVFQSGVAVGRLASAIGSVAIGHEARAGSVAGTFPGQTSARVGTALGAGTQADGHRSIAIGTARNRTTFATGAEAISMGNAAAARGNQSIAIGNSTPDTAGNYTLATRHSANGVAAISLGYQSQADGDNSIVLGRGSKAVGNDSIAQGRDTKAEALRAISIGSISEATKESATAVGYYSQARGKDATALGHFARAYAENATALGRYAKAEGEHSIAAGSGAHAEGIRSTAVGFQSYAFANESFGSVALGDEARAEAFQTVAVGSRALARESQAMAIGNDVSADGYGSIGIGGDDLVSPETSVFDDYIVDRGVYFQGDKGSYDPFTGDLLPGRTDPGDGGATKSTGYLRTQTLGVGSTAIGTSSIAYDTGATAIGAAAFARGEFSTAIGSMNDAEGFASLALGKQSHAQGARSIAMGSGSQATGVDSLAIGTDAVASGDKSISVGYANVVSGSGSGAFGDPTTITGAGSYSVGNDNTIDADEAGTFGNRNTLTATADGSRIMGNDNNLDVADAFVMGNGADVTVESGVALGSNSVSSTGAGIQGYNPLTGAADGADTAIAATESTTGAVAVGDATNGIYRQITGVSAGTQDSDAVNVAQLKASETHYYSVNDNGVQQGNYANDGATGINSLAAGTNATALGESSVAVGDGARSNSDGSIAIGENAESGLGANNENHSIAIGTDSQSYAYSIALGKGAVADQIGQEEGKGGIAIGNNAETAPATEGGVALGNFSKVADWANDGVALGTGAVANKEGGVALGANSNANTDAGVAGYVPFGATAADSTNISGTIAQQGAVDIGSRQITSVAAGTELDDAVNVSQLIAAQSKVEAGTNVADVAVTENLDGGTIYTVNAEGASVSEGSTAVTVTPTGPDANNVTDYAVDLSQNTKDDIANANKGWDVQVNAEAADNVAPGETVQFIDGKNIDITRDGDQIIKVATADNVEFNQVTIGDATNNTVITSTADGLDVGGDKITNVADGEISDTSTDAVNGSQLFATNENVTNNTTNITNNTTEIGKGINFGDGATANNYALGDTINVKGDPNVTSTTTVDGVQLGLADVVNIGSTNPVTIDGNTGTIGGLTNTTFDPNATYTGGQAATQEQLSQVNTGLVTEGLNFTGNDNSAGDVHRDLGQTLAIQGEATSGGTYTGANLKTVTDPLTGAINLQMTDSPDFTNVNVTNQLDVAGDTNIGGNTTIQGDTTVKGDTFLGDNFSVVNNEAIYDGPINNDNSVVNKQYVDGKETHYYSVNDNGVIQGNYDNDGATGINALAAGTNTKAEGNSSVVVGDGARTASVGEQQVAVGANALAGGNKSIAIGSGAKASTDMFDGGVEAVAIGNNASAQGTKNVALGSGSVADGSTLSTAAYQPLDVNGNPAAVAAPTAGSEVSVGSAGNERRITNVAAGAEDTDAVNVSQLKAVNDVASAGWNVQTNGDAATNVAPNATVQFIDGKNIDITRIGTDITVATADDVDFTNVNVTNQLDVAGDTNIGGNTTIQGDTTVKGDTFLGDNFSVVNNEAIYNVEPDQIINDYQVTNKKYVDNSVTALGDTPLTFMGDSGTQFDRKLGETANVKGGNTGTLTDGNIGVVADGTDTLNIKLAENVDLGLNGSVVMGDTTVNNDGLTIAGGPSITNTGIDAGNTTITNVAAGVNGTDAVNVDQLTNVETDLTTKGLDFAGNEGADVHRDLGETLAITGEATAAGTYTGANLKTVTDPLTGAINLQMTDSPDFTNVNVTNQLDVAGDTNIGGNTTIQGDTTVKGDTFLGDNFSVVNNEAIYNVEPDQIINDYQVTNKKYVDNSVTALGDTPLTFMGDSGTQFDRKLGETANVKGGNTGTLTDGNIGVVADGTDTLNIKLAENVDLGLNGSVVMGDTTVNNDGLTIAGGPSITNTGIDAGNTTITNVAAGVDGTDAVNVDQLTNVETDLTTKGLDFAGNEGADVHRDLGQTLAIQGEATSGGTYTGANLKTVTDPLTGAINLQMTDSPDFTNVNVTNQLDVAGDTNIGGNTTIQGDTTVKGDTFLGDNFSVVNNEAIYNVEPDQIINDYQVTNKKYVDNSVTALGDTPLTFMGDSGTQFDRKLGETANVKGGNTGTLTDGNIGVVADGTDTLNIKLAENVDLGLNGSVVMGDTTVNNDGLTIAGGPSITNTGIDAGNTTITNVAAGVDGTDAVNVDQLTNVETDLTTKGLDFAGNEGADVHRDLGETLAITGEATAAGTYTGANLKTVTDPLTGAINLQMTDSPDFTNVNVTNQLDVAGDTNIGGNTTIQGDTTVKGDTFLGDNFSVVNNEAIYNVEPDQIINDYQVTNKKYVDNSVTALGDTPLTFMGDSGTQFDRKLGETANVKGGNTGTLTDGNIGVVADGTDTLNIKLAENVDLGLNGSVVMGDTTVNNDGLTIAGGPSITNTGIDAGNTTITNVAAGVNGTDAVNVDQLTDVSDVANKGWNVQANGDVATNVAPGDTVQMIDGKNIAITRDGKDITVATADDVEFTNVEITENLNVAGDTAIGGNTTIAGNTTIEGDTTVKGDTFLGDNFSVVNNEAIYNVEPDQIINDYQVTNKKYVDNSVTALGDTPLTFMGDSGTQFDRKLGETANVKGGNTGTLTDGNIGVVADGTDTLNIKLAENVDLGLNGSVVMGDTTVNNDGLTIAGGPSITNTGIDAGNTTITNVAAGVNGTDAVNVDQLTNVETDLTTKGLDFAGNEGADVHRDLGETLAITGEATAAGTYTGANLKTVTDPLTGAINLQMTDSPDFTNVNVTNQLDVAGDTNIGGNTTIQGDTTVKGDTFLGDNFSVVNNEAIYNVEPDQIINDYQVTNKKYVDNSVTALGDTPLTFMGDSGTQFDRKLGETANVKGGNTGTLTDGNIGVVADGTDTLNIKLAENVDLGLNGSVVMGDTTVNNDGLTIAGGPSITNTGIDAGNTTITNVAAGVNGTDAVNVDQLTDVSDVANKGWNVQANGDVATNVAPGDTVQMIDGKNIAITRDGKDITVATADDVEFTNVEITENLNVAGDTAIGGNTTIAGNTTIEGDTTAKGDTFLGDNFSVVNNEAYYSGPITDGDHITNKTYVDGLGDDLVAEGLNFAGNDGVEIHKDLGEQLNIVGGMTDLTADAASAENLRTVRNADGELEIQLSKNLTNLESVDSTTVNVTEELTVANNTTINEGGITTNNVDITENLTVAGETKLGDNFFVNNEGNVTYTGDITEGDHITNKTYVDGLGDDLVAEGLNFVGNDGELIHKDLGATLDIVGGMTDLTADAASAENIRTIQNADGELEIQLSKNLTNLESVDSTTVNVTEELTVANNTTINEGGITTNNVDITENLTVAGETKLGDNFFVNNEGNVTYTGDITEGGHITNKTYVDGLGDDLIAEGLNFVGNDGELIHKDLGEQLNIVGGMTDLTADAASAENLRTVRNTDGELEVQLSKNLTNLESVDSTTVNVTEELTVANNTTINEGGITTNNVDITENLTVAGETKLGDNFFVNNEGNVTYTGDITEGGHITNKTYVDGLGDDLIAEGLNFVGNDGELIHKDLGEQLNIVGGMTDLTADAASAENLRTVRNTDGELEVQLSKNLTNLESVDSTTVNVTEELTVANNTTINEGGITTNNVDITENLTVAGETKLGDNFFVNNEGNVTYDGDITENNHITNKQYVDNSVTELGDTPLTFGANEGDDTDRRLGDRLDIVGEEDAEGDSNIITKITDEETLELALNDDLKIGNSITVGDTFIDGDSVTTNNLTVNENLTVEGETRLGDNFFVNNEGNVTYDGDITEGNHVTNKSYVDNSVTELGDTPLTFAGDSGESFERRLGEQTNVKGGAEGGLTEGNIGVVADGEDTLNIQLAENIDLGEDGSLTINETLIDGNQITTNNVTVNETLTVEGDTFLNENLTVEGDTYLGDSFSIVNNEAYYDGPITEDTHITNKSYVDNSVTELGDTPLTFGANEGDDTDRRLGDRLDIVGEEDAEGDSNIITKITDEETLELALNDDLKIGNSITVGDTFIDSDSVTTNNLTVNENLTVEGETRLGDNFFVNNEGNVTYDGDITEGNHITNKQYVDNSVNEIADTPLTFGANEGEDTERRLGDRLDIVGEVDEEGNSNIITKLTDEQTLELALNDDLKVGNSITVGEGGPTISSDGIDMGDNKITNVTDGDVSADSKDAINGSQLYQLESIVTNVTGDVSNEYVTNNGRGIRYVRTNDSGLAVSDAFAQGQGSTAVGYEAVASADRALAMGYDAIASHQGSVALGEGARTAAAVGTASVEIAGQTYQFAGTSPVATVSVGSVGAERTVTNVAAGRISAESTDAINGSQLYATNQAVGALDNRVTTVEGDISNITNDLADLDDRAVQYDRNDDGSVDYNTITLEGDGGTKITNVAPGDIAQNSSDAVNGSQLWDVQNQITNIEQGGSKYFRANSDGPAADPQGADSIAMGPSSVASGDRSVASGAGAQANAEGSVALGADSVADREGMNGERERFSNESVASTQGAVSVGSAGNERQITNVAGGTRDTDAVNVRQLDAVQRGAVNYDRDEDGNVDYSTITLKGDEGTTITNVAPGINETDAVNVGQMNELGRRFENEIVNVHGRIDSVERNANAGSASAIAASTVPQAWMPGKSMIGVGAGTYGGESAVSVGISRLSDNGRWVIQGKVTGDSQSNFGAGIGAGWHW